MMHDARCVHGFPSVPGVEGQLGTGSVQQAPKMHENVLEANRAPSGLIGTTSRHEVQ